MVLACPEQAPVPVGRSEVGTLDVWLSLVPRRRSRSAVRAQPRSGPRVRGPLRGQALTEFALILPILLILLLGVADLGRLFAAGIIVQAASRDAAEAAAQEYVQLVQSSPVDDTTLYPMLHDEAQQVACNESRQLLGVTTTTVTDQATGDTYTACTMPAVAVCVHDQGYSGGGTGDTNCGATASGSPPSACTQLQSSAGWITSVDATGLPYVEVRLCYRFDMLTQASTFHLGPLWLQQSSNFVSAVYP